MVQAVRKSNGLSGTLRRYDVVRASKRRTNVTLTSERRHLRRVIITLMRHSDVISTHYTYIDAT